MSSIQRCLFELLLENGLIALAHGGKGKKGASDRNSFDSNPKDLQKWQSFLMVPQHQFAPRLPAKAISTHCAQRRRVVDRLLQLRLEPADALYLVSVLTPPLAMQVGLLGYRMCCETDLVDSIPRCRTLEAAGPWCEGTLYASWPPPLQHPAYHFPLHYVGRERVASWCQLRRQT